MDLGFIIKKGITAICFLVIVYGIKCLWIQHEVERGKGIKLMQSFIFKMDFKVILKACNRLREGFKENALYWIGFSFLFFSISLENEIRDLLGNRMTSYYMLLLAVYYITDASYRFRKIVNGFGVIFIMTFTAIGIIWTIYPLWLYFLLFSTKYVDFGISMLAILFFVCPSFILLQTMLGACNNKSIISLIKKAFYGAMFLCTLMIFGTFNILNENAFNDVFSEGMTFTESIIATINYGVITASQGIVNYPKEENIIKLIQGIIFTISTFMLSKMTLINLKPNKE